MRSPSIYASKPLLEDLPTVDPVTGTPIKYEYVDYPASPSPSIVKRVVEKKVGTKEVVEDVIVEVPDVQYKDVVRKVPRTKETAVEKPVRQVHVRQIQEVRRIPKVVERKIPKRVEVKGEPKEIHVVNEIITHNPVDKFLSKEQAVVVAQTVKPSVRVNDKCVEVPVARLTPVVNYVDVHVALPIKRNSDFTVVRDDHFHKPAHVPDAQFNSLLVAMNGHLNEDQLQDLPFKRGIRGEVNVSPERMNAILLNPTEARSIGIEPRQPVEIYPRGKPTNPIDRISVASGANLMSGMSNLSAVGDHRGARRSPSHEQNHHTQQHLHSIHVPVTPINSSSSHRILTSKSRA